MKKYAVIVAGGTGARMKSSIPKQFLLLNHKPVLYYTIDAFLRAWPDLHINLVLPEAHMAEGQQIINAYFDNKRISLIAGGKTRFHSVQSGLAHINEECIIFVHDGVRCLITTDLIYRCYQAAADFGTAIPVITSKDSVRIITKNGNEPLDRNNIKLVQTPQTFHSKILLEAYKKDYKDAFTDEATVVEAFGLKVHLIEGEVNNIKITEPVDLLLAENILSHFPVYKPK